MLNSLFCFILICLPFVLTAQMQTFVHTPIGKVDRFSSKQDTINLSEYIASQRGSLQRMVSFNHVDYKIVIYSAKSGKKKEVYDKDGNKLVTMALSGREKINIQFNDGRHLKWQSTVNLAMDISKTTRKP